jgi:hypothetical protein
MIQLKVHRHRHFFGKLTKNNRNLRQKNKKYEGLPLIILLKRFFLQQMIITGHLLGERCLKLIDLVENITKVGPRDLSI